MTVSYSIRVEDTPGIFKAECSVAPWLPPQARPSQVQALHHQSLQAVLQIMVVFEAFVVHSAITIVIIVISVSIKIEILP